MAYTNRTLVITYDHVIASGDITLQPGMTLVFEGGSITSSGNIIGNNSRIINDFNLPCFNTSINFTGTWSETTCNFQWFGARSVPTTATFSNECSAAINKAVNSPFQVTPLPGYYYVTSPIYFTKPKSIFMGACVVENVGDGSLSASMIPDHVRFFTNQNIDVLDIQVSNVHLIGGVVDVRNVVGAYTKDAIGVHNTRISGSGNYWDETGYTGRSVTILKGTIEMGVVGSRAGTITLGASGKAFHWSMTNNVDYACMHQMKVDLYVSCIPYGIYIDDMTTGHPNTNMGANFFNCIADGCKQGFHVENGFHNTYSGYTQTRGVLDYTEQDMYQAEFNGGNILDIFNWDLSSRDHLEYGGYYPSRGTLIKGDSNYLIGASLKNLSIVYESSMYKPTAVFPVTHKSKMAVLAQKLNKTNFISEINNMLIGWDKKGAVTVKAHSGATIDFDSLTPTIGSEAETSNITISNTGTLFTLFGSPTYYIFNASSDLDKDFIEIALTGRNIQGRYAYIYLSANSLKRVQVIGFKSVGNPDIFNTLFNPLDNVSGDKSFSFALPSTAYTSMAIRLVGSPSTRKTATISLGNPAIVTSSAYGLSNLTSISFATTGTLPTPLLPNVNYYLRAITGNVNAFNLSSTSSGPLIETTDAGSGTHSFIDNQYIYINDIAVEPMGATEGHTFVPATSAPRGTFHGFLNQTGIVDGTVTTFLNSFYSSASATVTPTLTRHGLGVYRFNMSDRFPTNKTMPKTAYTVYVPLGRVQVTLNGTGRYDILTFNTLDVASDNILVDFPLIINTYW